MADRIPLIVNPAAAQIQETPENDRLIVGLTTITASTVGNVGNAGINQTGVITATTFNATSSFTGPGATFGNIQIAVTGDNIIDTTTGDLNLDAAGGDINIDNGCIFHVLNNTNATSDTTGALQVTGGMSCQDACWVGTKLSVDGNCDLGNSTSDAVVCAGTLEVGSNTNSTSKSTGALTVVGGVGIDDALFVGGDITAFASSDERLKDNVTPIPNALDKVLSISGNTFNWNAASDYEGQSGTGVIAQEIDKLNLPGVVETRDNGTLAVRYDRLVPLLIEAIKELKSEVDELKSHTH